MDGLEDHRFLFGKFLFVFVGLFSGAKLLGFRKCIPWLYLNVCFGQASKAYLNVSSNPPYLGVGSVGEPQLWTAFREKKIMRSCGGWRWWWKTYWLRLQFGTIGFSKLEEWRAFTNSSMESANSGFQCGYKICKFSSLSRKKSHEKWSSHFNQLQILPGKRQDM